MKYLKFFLVLLFMPFVVNAEECDLSNITITSIEQSSIEGNTLVVNEPTINGVNINFDLKMYNVGDSITYDLRIKNDSKEDYMINENTFKTDSSYIEYSLKTNDNSNVVKAQSVKGVTLIVEYKNEIEDELLSNNTYDASNSLKLSLSTDGKEKALDIITTSSMEKAKNPLTKTSSILLISLVLLTTIIIIYILEKRKNKYTKYILIALSIVLVPTVYAMCQVDIEVESKIEIEKVPKLYDTVVNISKEENACVTRYEGDVTDEVGKTVNATNVYFDKCADRRNVIYGGFCWQVVRTTETKGTKLVYNGRPVDGKCNFENSALGVIGSSVIEDLSGDYKYGTSFTYDTTTGTFTLTDTNNSTWSASTYENLIGKYTCKNSMGTCTTLYSINGYLNNMEAYVSKYIIGEINPSIIGETPFNANYNSPTAAGYMFTNDNYTRLKSTGLTNIKYSNNYTYDENTNTYTLTGTIRTPSSWSAYTPTSSIRYTCWNTTGTCTTLSHIYYIDSSSAYYMELKNGKTAIEEIEEMTTSDNVNKYSSNIKGVVDSWYKQNLNNYTKDLEDIVYCNARNITNTYGWIDSYSNDGGVRYKNYNENGDLTCPSATDQFSISNNKAKLKYPVALITNEEWINIGDIDLRRIGTAYWDLSPLAFNDSYVEIRYIYSQGFTSINYYEATSSGSSIGARPAISLINGKLISSGSGSTVDPWVVK